MDPEIHFGTVAPGRLQTQTEISTRSLRMARLIQPLLPNGFPSLGDYGDTFLKLSTPGSLAVSDYFTPFDQAVAAASDTDLGSGGAVVLPDMVDASGTTRHLAVGAGKDTNIYLVNRDNLGKFIPGAPSNSDIYQELVGALPGGVWATAAYFNGAIYYGPVGGALRRFTFSQARLDQVPAAMTSTVFGYPGTTPSISSSGTNAGIVWAYENTNSGNDAAILHAYDAANLAELYNSSQNASRDQFGTSNKFITPTVCDGKVFVGTTNSVGVFGLLVSPGSNGGGHADLLWEYTPTGDYYIWLMQGTVHISNIYLGQVPAPWRLAGKGDFNGDGQTDLVWENTVTGQRAIWFLKNGTLVSSIYLPSVSTDWHITGAGDFNGDGQADLVWENTITGERAIWFLNHGTVASTTNLPTVSTDWHITGVGDFNGDGQADLVWENTITGERAIWFLNHGTVASTTNLPTVSTDWHIAGAADFNGDGQADLVWENTITGERAIWSLNNGVITSSVILGFLPTAWEITEH